eukprot:6175264-Pleurochrysis_carterae.AAC.1
MATVRRDTNASEQGARVRIPYTVGSMQAWHWQRCMTLDIPLSTIPRKFSIPVIPLQYLAIKMRTDLTRCGIGRCGDAIFSIARRGTGNDGVRSLPGLPRHLSLQHSVGMEGACYAHDPC